VIEFGIF